MALDELVPADMPRHRTLAWRSKEPTAAVSELASSSDPINQLTEVDLNMQPELSTFWPDAGDLHALGKTGYKGGGAKGLGG